MVDVGRISGPGSPSEPPGGKSRPTPEKEFEHYFKVGEADPEQKKKKQEKEAAHKKKKAEQILQAGSLVPKETPPKDINFQKKGKVEKIKESEKRQAQSEKRREEEVKEIQQAVKTENIAARKILTDKKAAPIEKKEPAPDRKMANDTSEELSPPPPPPPPAPEEKKVEEEAAPLPSPPKETSKKEEHLQLPPPPPLEAPIPLMIPPASAASLGYTALRAEILALFERMVSVISVIHESGITETTIHLTAEMAGGLFAGAQIVIKEYSTAPKAFNIEFLGTAQSAALFNQNIAGLVAAFQNGNYNFKVHRLESKLLPSERPLFHRKEKVGDQEEDHPKREGDS
jgi:hypothetical protein